MEDALKLNEISALLKTGSAEGLEQLYDALGDTLFGYIIFLTGSQNEAEDILSDLFVNIAKAAGRVATARNVKAYVFTMARRLVWRRWKTRQLRSEAEIEFHKFLETDNVNADPETIDRLNMGLSRLPPEQREVLMLKFYQDMTFAQIAECVRQSINTVASRYRYAIQKLKSHMEETA